MAPEERMFDPSLKKRKKKTVAFTEDSLGADADPTTPAPVGGADDELGTTVHEQQSALRDESAKDAGGSRDNVDTTDGVNGGADDLNAMFGGLKKKKKKEIPMDLGEEGSGTSTPAGGAEPAEELDFSDLKKKKKKKDIPLDLDEGSGASTPLMKEGEDGTAGDDLDFSDLKKPKKKKKKAVFDLEAFERELGEGPEDVEGGKSVDKASRSEREEDIGDVVFGGGEGEGAGRRGAADSDPWLGSDRNYTYPELLRRFYSQLHAANPSLLTSGKRYTIPPPQIHREGNKKSIFANVEDTCKRLHRQPEHVIQFMFAEMGTTGSVDGERRLVIKGRFQQKQIENVLRRYIAEYVTCKTCKSLDTLLQKENRIFFVQCESCGSRRSVNAIKTGFQAQAAKRTKS